MKKCLLILLLLLMLFYTACDNHLDNVQKPGESSFSTEEDIEDTQAPPKTSSPIYILANSRFLGSYYCGEWNSLFCSEDNRDISKFMLKDVVAGKYVCYQAGVKIYDAAQLRLSPACLINVDIDLLRQFGTSYFSEDGNEYYIFPSPLKLDEKFNNVFLPASNVFVYFGTDDGFPQADFSDSLNVPRKRLDLSADFNPFHREINSIEPTQAAIKELCRLFEENDMANTYPVFYEAYSGDFDGDGRKESAFFANSLRGENLGIAIKAYEGKTDKLGTYTVILYQDDDGSFETVFSDFRLYSGDFTPNLDNEMELPFGEQERHFQYIASVIIADVNNDGLFEIICEFVGQGSSSGLLFAQEVQGTYTNVLSAYNS
ncbi:hypothetical protein SDC9_65439 [bioreactor metagenome]|uniref:Uncharacterized protein n=1 Tax=bioreactor metagenome TaxID=1076179 RepID=A0A644XTD2_9ZZZZ